MNIIWIKMNTNTHTTKIQTIINPKSHSSKPKFVNWVINIFDCFFFAVIVVLCVCNNDSIRFKLNGLFIGCWIDHSAIHLFIHSFIDCFRIYQREWKKNNVPIQSNWQSQKKSEWDLFGFYFSFFGYSCIYSRRVSQVCR